MVDQDKFLEFAEQHVIHWTGITAPNGIAKRQAAHLLPVAGQFSAMSYPVQFEDEPSDFVMALRACRD